MKYLLLVAFGPLFVKTASPKPEPLTLCPKENYHGLIMVARSTFFNQSLSSKKINFSDNSFFKLSSTTYKFYPNTNLKSFWLPETNTTLHNQKLFIFQVDHYLSEMKILPLLDCCKCNSL